MALSASELAIIIRAQDQASSVFREVQRSAGGMSGALADVAKNAAGFALGAVAVQGFGAAIGAVKEAAVGFNSQLEQTSIAWKTFTGSAQGAQAVIQQVQQIAASTPFEFEDVNRAALRFVNAGMSAQQALSFITPLSNAIASVGGGSAAVDQVSRAIGQIGAKGKVSAEEINQLAEAGINGWEVLAEAMGKPIPAVQQLAQQGKISAQQFDNAFSQFFGAGSKFADAATDQAKSFQGSLSTISDQLKFVGATAFKPLFDAISQLAQHIAAFVQSDQFTVWGGRVQAVVGLVVDGVGALASAFSRGLGGVLSIVSSTGQSIYQALQWINPFASHSPPLVDQVADGVSAIEGSFGRLGSASSAFDGVRAAFENLTTVTSAFSDEFGDALPSKIEKAIALIGPGARGAFDQARDAMDAAKSSLADINAQWSDARDALAPLKDALDGAKDSLQDQQRTLGDLKGQLSDAKDAYGPLKAELDSFKQSAKDAEEEIRRLGDAQLAGSGEFASKIADADIAVKSQTLSLSRLKQSDAYKSIAQQIDQANDRVKQLQHTEASTAAAREAQRKAIDEQRALIDRLKDSQEGLLVPAQRELDQRKDALDAIRLERDATLGLAEDRVKAAAQAALGGKELTEQQVVESIAAAKAAREKALQQAGGLEPQVAGQQKVIDDLAVAVRNQEKTVSDAQKAVDSASEAYDVQKKSVDALAESYRAGKQELEGYDQQLKSVLQTAELQVQKAAEAEKAAKAAAKAGAGAAAPGGGKVDVAAGLDIEGAKQKAAEFQAQVQATRQRVLELLSPISRALQTVGNAIGPLVDWFRRLGPPVQSFALAAGGVGAAVTVLAPAFAGLVPVLAGLLSPIGLLTVAAGLLGGALITNLGGIRDAVLAPLAAGATALLATLAPLGAGLGELASTLGAAFAQLTGGNIGGALDTAGTALNGFLDVLLGVRKALIEQLASWGAAFVDWLLPRVPELLDQLTGVASVLVGWIVGQADRYLKQLGAWGEAFVSWLLPRVPAILSMLASVGTRLIDWIGQQGTILAGKLGQWAAGFLAWIPPMLPRFATALEQIAGAVLDFVIGAVPRILGALADWVGAFLGWVLPLIPPLLGDLAKFAAELIRWIVEEALPKVVAGLAKWAVAFVEWVGPRIGPLLEETGKLLVALIGWIGEQTPKVVTKLVEWGQAFIGWIGAEVLPKLGQALGYIWSGGQGWEGLEKWIPEQVDNIAAALGAWAGAFVAWIVDVVKNLPTELPKILAAIADWVTQSGPTVAGSSKDIGVQMISGIVAGLGGLKDALLKTAGDAFDAFKREFGRSLAGGGGAGGTSGAINAAVGASSAQIEAYVRQAAAARNIDPNIAARVAGAESGNFTKFVGDFGDNGVASSFGPFQLHLGGLASGGKSVSGLGDSFKAATGLDPRDLTTWSQQVDYALDYAAKHGWAAWHAAAAVGVADWAGIGQAASQAAPLVTDATLSIQSIAQPVADMSGSFLELAAGAQTNFGTVRDAAAALADQFGLSIDAATRIVNDHGSVAKAVLGEAVPGAFTLTDQAVEQFAAFFQVSWDQARAILQSSGATAELVLGDVIPGSADKTTDAIDAATQAHKDLVGPVGDVRSATRDLASEGFDKAKDAATQVSFVLQQLDDRMPDLISKIHDFTDALNKIPRDITVTIHTVGSVPSSAGGGGGGGGGSSKSSSSDSSTGDVDMGRAETDQNYRDQLRDNYNVGRDDNGKLYVEPKARGGRVQGGSPYLVGEQGPELFMPRSSGTIAPNGAWAGIDYDLLADKIGDRVAAALSGVNLAVDVNDVHSSLLRKRVRNGSLGLS